MKQEIKKLFDRPEVYFVITAGLVCALLSLLLTLPGSIFSKADMPSASQAAMIWQGGFGEVYGAVLLPACSVLPYVDSYFREKKAGVLACLMPRCGRSRYLWHKALTSVLAAIAVVVLPYLCNQLCCLVAYPVEQTQTYLAGYSVYDNAIAQEVAHTPTPALYMNHPLLLNFLHIGYAGVYAGGIALVGYALSLYIHRNRAVANLLPIAAVLIWTFVAMYLFGVEYAPYYALPAAPIYSVSTLWPSLAVIAGMYLAGIAGVAVRSYRYKDEL